MVPRSAPMVAMVKLSALMNLCVAHARDADDNNLLQMNSAVRRGITPSKVESCVGKACEFKSFPHDQVHEALEVGSGPEVPASLRGLWFMDGNPLPDTVISLATTFADEGDDTVVGRLPLDSSNLLALHDNEEGRILGKLALSAQAFYEFRCTFSGNRDNVTFCRISPSIFGSPVFPISPIFAWTMDVLSKNDDRHIQEDGENADEQLSFVRDSSMFGQEGAYILRRIVDQHGQKLQNNWNHFASQMQQEGHHTLTNVHNTQQVSEPEPGHAQLRLLGKALVGEVFSSLVESLPFGDNVTSKIMASVIPLVSDSTTTDVYDCDRSNNFVRDAKYSQITLTAKYGVEEDKSCNDISVAKALAYCKAECTDRRPGCTGFFFQKHNNGHEICGFYSNAVNATNLVKHGHQQCSQVCILRTATDILPDLRYQTLIDRPGRCDQQTTVASLERAMELGVAMAISTGHERPVLGGLAAVLDHLISTFTLDVWVKAYEDGGKQPINPATDPFIWGDSPLPYPASAVLFTWGELLYMLAGLVRLPLVREPFHANGNFTYYFLQKAQQNCYDIQPFVEGPMIFSYDEVAAVLADPTQPRGFYVATIKQNQQSFNLDSPLFLDSGSEQHNQFRDILEITQFANPKMLDREILDHVRTMSKEGPIVDGMVSTQRIVLATFPAIQAALWGQFPSRDQWAIAGYLQAGGIGVFGTVAHDLIMGVRMTHGEPSITESLLGLRKAALQFANNTPYALKLKESPEVQKYITQFPGLFYSKPWNKKLGYNTEMEHFIMNLQDAGLFAGLIGTTQLAEGCINYQQNNTVMKALFEEDPELFIIELMRYEAAVRSVTSLYKEDKEEVILGKRIAFQAGTPYQVVMASANRDPTVFEEPNKFDPRRPELGEMLSWNGKLRDVEAHNRTAAPRFCPGYCLAMKLGALVCAGFMGSLETLLDSGKLVLGSECNHFQ